MVRRILSSAFCGSQAGITGSSMNYKKRNKRNKLIHRRRSDDTRRDTRPDIAHHHHHRRNLSVHSYHCLVFFALSCANENTFHPSLHAACIGNDHNWGLTLPTKSRSNISATGRWLRKAKLGTALLPIGRHWYRTKGHTSM